MKGLILHRVGLALGVVAFTLLVSHPSPAQQKKQIQPGVYAMTLKTGDSIDASIARGKKLFNEIGCGGCHPRGGTIGGTAFDVAGNRFPIPIPALRGSALHFPRIGMGPARAVLTLGQLNDL
ncbi:MAG: hypothetical protein ACE5I9_03315 [Candidatus Methylomirabilales bacterium]